jgi:hypothetical protein
VTILASAALVLTFASVLIIGGALFAPFLFGLFLLGLIGVIAGSEDRTVRRHDPPMSPRTWRVARNRGFDQTSRPGGD